MGQNETYCKRIFYGLIFVTLPHPTLIRVGSGPLLFVWTRRAEPALIEVVFW